MALLRRQQDGAVLRLVLDDDRTRNSLSEQMIAELRDALDAATHDKTVHVVIISAVGSAFSSGHNLKELTAHRADADGGEAYYRSIFEGCAELMLAIARHRTAVIAEVDGLASAAGCQLAASCDLCYCSPRATFCTPGVSIGLFCATPMVALSRALNSRHALEMLLTGEIKDADFAYRAGLVNAVVPQNELSSHVMAIARTIADKSQGAIAYGKAAFRAQADAELGAAYAMTAAVMTRNMLDPHAIEGLSAFIAKRKPEWPEVP